MKYFEVTLIASDEILKEYYRQHGCPKTFYLKEETEKSAEKICLREFSLDNKAKTTGLEKLSKAEHFHIKPLSPEEFQARAVKCEKININNTIFWWGK